MWPQVPHNLIVRPSDIKQRSTALQRECRHLRGHDTLISAGELSGNWTAPTILLGTKTARCNRLCRVRTRNRQSFLRLCIAVQQINMNRALQILRIDRFVTAEKAAGFLTIPRS